MNKVNSSNLEFSWASHCGALSGEVFQFQSDVSSTCIIILVEKHNLILVKWDSSPNRISKQHSLSFTFFFCELWRKWMVARRSMGFQLQLQMEWRYTRTKTPIFWFTKLTAVINLQLNYRPTTPQPFQMAKIQKSVTKIFQKKCIV